MLFWPWRDPSELGFLQGTEKGLGGGSCSNNPPADITNSYFKARSPATGLWPWPKANGRPGQEGLSRGCRSQALRSVHRAVSVSCAAAPNANFFGPRVLPSHSFLGFLKSWSFCEHLCLESGTARFPCTPAPVCIALLCCASVSCHQTCQAALTGSPLGPGMRAVHKFIASSRPLRKEISAHANARSLWPSGHTCWPAWSHDPKPLTQIEPMPPHVSTKVSPLCCTLLSLGGPCPSVICLHWFCPHSLPPLAPGPEPVIGFLAQVGNLCSGWFWCILPVPVHGPASFQLLCTNGCPATLNNLMFCCSVFRYHSVKYVSCLNSWYSVWAYLREVSSSQPIGCVWSRVRKGQLVQIWPATSGSQEGVHGRGMGYTPRPSTPQQSPKEPSYWISDFQPFYTYPVHFNNKTWLSFLKAEVGIHQAWAVLQHVCCELAGELGVVRGPEAFLGEYLLRGAVYVVLLGCWRVACRYRHLWAPSSNCSHPGADRR